MTVVQQPQEIASGALGLARASQSWRPDLQAGPHVRRCAHPHPSGFLVYELWSGARLAAGRFGLDFITSSTWDPVAEEFGAFPLIFGTLVSSLIALLIAVPLSLGVAIYLTEFAPKVVRQPVAFLIGLLAAIPSVVYGLWGIFVLVPAAPHHRLSAAAEGLWIPPAVPGPDLRPVDARRRNHPRHHGDAVRDVGVPGGVAGRPEHPAGSGPGTRRHALGSSHQRRGSLRPLRH